MHWRMDFMPSRLPKAQRAVTRHPSRHASPSVSTDIEQSENKSLSESTPEGLPRSRPTRQVAGKRKVTVGSAPPGPQPYEPAHKKRRGGGGSGRRSAAPWRSAPARALLPFRARSACAGGAYEAAGVYRLDSRVGGMAIDIASAVGQ